MNLDAIKERLAAATPGPWFWHGNTDTHSVALCGREPGIGVCEVISTVRVDRSLKGREADRIRESMLEHTDLDEEGVEEAMEDWIHDPWTGETRADERLAITDEKYIRRAVEEIPVYSVARAQGLPDDTPRDHEKIYRADICDVRVPNGAFLANSWQDVSDLVGEVERVTNGLEALMTVPYDHTPDCEKEHAAWEDFDFHPDCGACWQDRIRPLVERKLS